MSFRIHLTPSRTGFLNCPLCFVQNSLDSCLDAMNHALFAR